MKIGLREENGTQYLTGFGRPFGLLKDSLGRLLVTDMSLHCVFRFAPDLDQVEWLGGSNLSWVSLGPVQRELTFAQRRAVAAGRFNGAHSVCELESGQLVILTYYAPALHLIDLSGAPAGNIGCGYLSGPATVTLDSQGRLLVTEYARNGILAFDGRDVATGRFLGGLGGGKVGFSERSEFAAGSGRGYFDRPHMCRQIPGGDLLVADTWNHRIQRFSAEGKWIGWFGPYAGSAGVQPGKFYGPVSVFAADDGAIMITDWGNNRLQWFDELGNLLSVEDRRGLSKPYDAIVFEDQVIATDSEKGRVLLWTR